MANVHARRILHHPRWLAWLGAPIVALVVLALVWNWDWFIPIVQSRAAAALGRPVTVGHLHVRLGRIVVITADDVIIKNPADWPADDPPLASIGRLTVQADAWRGIRGGGLVLPLIALDDPHVYAAETADGTPNFKLAAGGSGGASPVIGDLRITGGEARVLIPKLRADFHASIATREDQPGSAKIIVDAKGTYADKPIEGHLVGGALLSLRDPREPWPVEVTLANGPTHVTLHGTLQDPVALRGANLDLRVDGPDMGLLEPLVGVPIPKTPAYQIAGKLDFAGYDQITFDDFHGRMGHSDLSGSIRMQPEAGRSGNQQAKPVVDMDLRSNRIDLADLYGALGGEPGRPETATAPRPQSDASTGKLLPNKPISVPRLNWADIHLRYRGAHIEGRNMPLDDVVVVADVVDGRVRVHPISFGVGKGALTANAELIPATEKTVRTKVDLQLRNLDLARMMAATHTFEGAGSISGVGSIDATGDSVASLLANGSGDAKMTMAGGDLSALLVDLSGLHFGKALLSALGMPQKTKVECFVGDLGLKHGLLKFDVLTLDTGEAIMNVDGGISFVDETIDLHLKTDSRNFSIGSLPTRINISGTLKDPSIRPGAEVAARAGAVAGLTAVFPPLGLLPTVQFGTSEAEDARCGLLLRRTRAQEAGKVPLTAPQGENAGTTPR